MRTIAHSAARRAAREGCARSVASQPAQCIGCGTCRTRELETVSWWSSALQFSLCNSDKISEEGRILVFDSLELKYKIIQSDGFIYLFTNFIFYTASNCYWGIRREKGADQGRTPVLLNSIKHWAWEYLFSSNPPKTWQYFVSSNAIIDKGRWGGPLHRKIAMLSAVRSGPAKLLARTARDYSYSRSN